MTNLSKTGIVIALVQGRVAKGLTMAEAARAIMLTYPQLTLDVMEVIGSNPSSDPELAAIQQEWKP